MKIMSKQNKQKYLQNPPKKEQTKQNKSYWEMLIGGIVRPPRAVYRDTQLGTKNFNYQDTVFSRIQQQVSHQDKHISLTILKPQNYNSWIILYLHGNSSSKFEAVSLLKYLPSKFSLGCFDFIGCGKNIEDDNVTLGARESRQVATIVDFLQKNNYRVILWGRSMGAASALKYGKAQVIVADSSFKCMKSLCKQVAKKHSPVFIPNCMINCLFPCVFFKLKQDVMKKAKYDIQQLDIKDAVKNIDHNSLVIFMSGDKDTLIHHRNSQKLYKAFPGQHKILQIFEGTHNTKRPEDVMLRVMGYIQKYANQHRQLAPKTPFQNNINSQNINLTVGV